MAFSNAAPIYLGQFHLPHINPWLSVGWEPLTSLSWQRDIVTVWGLAPEISLYTELLLLSLYENAL